MTRRVRCPAEDNVPRPEADHGLAERSRDVEVVEVRVVDVLPVRRLVQHDGRPCLVARVRCLCRLGPGRSGEARIVGHGVRGELQLHGAVVWVVCADLHRVPDRATADVRDAPAMRAAADTEVGRLQPVDRLAEDEPEGDRRAARRVGRDCGQRLDRRWAGVVARAGGRSNPARNPLPQLWERRVERVAGAGRGIHVAVAGDVVQPLRGAQQADVRGSPERIEPMPLQLPGEEPLQRDPRRGRGLAVLEVAEERDADGPVVVAASVDAAHDVAGEVLAGGRLAGGVVPRVPALVDPALFVDQEVVANVAIAPADRFRPVDRPNGRRGVRIAVSAGRVVDDRLLHG